jgi:calcineurin-like phosphoesterase family protein
LIAEFYLYDNEIEPYLPNEGKEKDKKLFVANAEKIIRDADVVWAALRDSKVAKDQNSISVAEIVK